MSHSLLTLFAPPDGYVGDFGMFCGFTASRDVLERIARAFSGVASRPRLAAFIHPTGAAVTDLPGIAWMHFKQPAPFRLLHAKVALLGFSGSRSEARSSSTEFLSGAQGGSMESKRGVGPKDRDSVGRPHHGSERCRAGMNFGRRAQRTFAPRPIPSATCTSQTRE